MSAIACPWRIVTFFHNDGTKSLVILFYYSHKTNTKVTRTRRFKALIRKRDSPVLIVLYVPVLTDKISSEIQFFHVLSSNLLFFFFGGGGHKCFLWGH